MRGYVANSCYVVYYKCNTKGCKCNCKANIVNSQFESLLDGYKVNDEYLPLIKEQLFITFQEHNITLLENEVAIKRQLTDLHNKIDRLEECFILEELTVDIYTKYKDKFLKEIEEITSQMRQNKIEMSKIEDYISF